MEPREQITILPEDGDSFRFKNPVIIEGRRYIQLDVIFVWDATKHYAQGETQIHCMGVPLHGIRRQTLLPLSVERFNSFITEGEKI